MEYLIAIGIILLIVSIVAILWVRGIDYMKEKHPEYKGEDFIDWESAEAPWVEEWNQQEEWYPNETL